MNLPHAIHRAGSRVRNSSPLVSQQWLWLALEPAWNWIFAQASERTGYLTHINGEIFRLEYQYGARYDREDRRTYEPEFYVPFVEHLRKGMTVFDVGAHVGIFSLAAGKRVGPTGRVFAFECAPDTVATLGRHIAFNNLGDRVEVVPKAVSDSSEGISFFAYRASMAASMARENVETLNPERRSEPAREVHVESVTLDGFAAAAGLRPNLIKIDVEGAELRVLRGSRRLLDEQAPTILCEIHPRQIANCGGSVGELLDLIKAADYEITPLDRPNPMGLYHALLTKSNL